MNTHEDLPKVVSTYFRAVYKGEVGTLRGLFHPEAELFGDVRGKRYRKSLTEYLEGVASRSAPEKLGDPFLMRTLFIDVAGPIAVAKLNCPMLGFNYMVYLSFVRVDGRWLIVNKTLTHAERKPGAPAN
jgi:hypothetical protein